MIGRRHAGPCCTPDCCEKGSDDPMDDCCHRAVPPDEFIDEHPDDGRPVVWTVIRRGDRVDEYYREAEPEDFYDLPNRML